MAGSNLPLVWDAVIKKLVTLIDKPPDATLEPSGWPVLALAGVSEGEKMSVSGSPWAFVTNADLDKPRETGGVQLEVTRWRLTIRCVCEWVNHEEAAEKILMSLVEQITDSFRSNTKIGLPSIVAGSEIRSGDWGYVILNEETYRSLDLHLEVTEKSVASRAV
jgi:hypothetical protein